jgi:hypothetical protein
MTNDNSAPPELSADFAVRVLQEADRVIAHRQRAWRIFAAGTAAVLLGFAGALGVRAVDKAPSTPPTVVADARPSALDAGNQADALDEMFPDAAPVERLDRTYLSGGADDLLAEDTADDDGGF